MPKKRKSVDDDDDDDDEEYRESEESESKDEDDDEIFVAETEEEADSKERTRNRKRMRKNDDILSDNENEVSTTARLTEKGGYAHTLASKLRISKANRGNTPWNKGGKRSAADKAKISEGVRARNRAILLEKLEQLGLTEEEWFEKKKQIKYLRERVRRAKAANQLKEMASHEKMLNAAISETTVEANEKRTTSRKKKTVETENRYARKALMSKVKQGKPSDVKARNGEAATKRNKKGKKITASAHPIVPSAVPSAVAAVVPGAKLPAMFARDINWTYHPYDSSESDSPYDSTCPKGGPGGLICCEDCTGSYSSFLTATSKNLEEQRTRKVANEVQELLEILSSGRSKLNGALRNAKQQSVPGYSMAVSRTRKKPPVKTKHSDAASQAKQTPGQLPQLPEFSFQFGENPPTLPEISVAGVAQLPPIQTFESDHEVIDTSPETVAV